MLMLVSSIDGDDEFDCKVENVPLFVELKTLYPHIYMISLPFSSTAIKEFISIVSHKIHTVNEFETLRLFDFVGYIPKTYLHLNPLIICELIKFYYFDIFKVLFKQSPEKFINHLHPEMLKEDDFRLLKVLTPRQILGLMNESLANVVMEYFQSYIHIPKIKTSIYLPLKIYRKTKTFFSSYFDVYPL